MSRKRIKLFFSGKGSDFLRTWCSERTVELVNFPLIAFSPVESFPFVIPDIIFYSSPRSVEFSSKLRAAFPRVLSAAIGKSTAARLEEAGTEVCFVGEKAGQPEKVAQAFKTWAGDRRVLFPVSDRSIGSISNAIPEAQREEIIVYRTELTGKSVPECDIYVFTSPSNWQSFLLKNVPAGKLIAWGNSTANAIRQVSDSLPLVLDEPDETALVGLLEKLIK